LVRVPA